MRRRRRRRARKAGPPPTARAGRPARTPGAAGGPAVQSGGRADIRRARRSCGPHAPRRRRRSDTKMQASAQAAPTSMPFYTLRAWAHSPPLKSASIIILRPSNINGALGHNSGFFVNKVKTPRLELHREERLTTGKNAPSLPYIHKGSLGRQMDGEQAPPAVYAVGCDSNSRGLLPSRALLGFSTDQQGGPEQVRPAVYSIGTISRLRRPSGASGR